MKDAMENRRRNQRKETLCVGTRRAVCLLAMLLGLAGCATVAPVFRSDENVTQGTQRGFLNSPNNFQFAILADRNGGNRPGIFEEAITKANLLQPEFVMCVGDLINGDPDDPASISNEWDAVENTLSKLEMPFFHLAGNHDIRSVNTLSAYQSRHGRPYYHFVYRDVLFLCLDTEDPPQAHISDAQADYFRGVLERNATVRWTLVFMHEPLWLAPEEKGFGRIEELLANRPYTVFAGHHHTYEKAVRNGRCYYKLATTGGASGLQAAAGQFDEVGWVTMTEKGPVLVNLLLNGIMDDALGKPAK